VSCSVSFFHIVPELMRKWRASVRYVELGAPEVPPMCAYMCVCKWVCLPVRALCPNKTSCRFQGLQTGS